MKKGSKIRQLISRELTEDEMQKLLSDIGKLIKAKRDGYATLERFAYEVNISRSQLTKYEAGGDMLLSTFLKVLNGLEISGETFFKELEKPGK